MTWIKDLYIPIVILILTPLLTSIGSQILTGDYIQWLKDIPILVWAIFIIIMILWLVIRLIQRRIKQMNELGFIKIPNPYYDWYDVGEITYNGIFWILRSTNTVNPEKDTMFATDPRCIKCKTELESSTSFWGGEVLKCIGCGYQKKIKSYHRESERAVKLARREFEKRKGL